MSAPSTATIELATRLVTVLAEAPSRQSAVTGVLAEVAGALDAPFAVLWTLDDQTGLLTWDQDWSSDPAITAACAAAGRRATCAPGVGMPGRVLERRQVAWETDIGAAPDPAPAHVARRSGLRSVVAGPLLAPEGVLGVIEFFGRDARAPTPDHLDQVTMAGRQLAAFLVRLGVQERLRASERSSADIVNAALDCVILMDHEGRVLDFNPAAEATFGYTRDEALGRPVADLIIPPRHRDAHRRALAAYVRHRTPTILGTRMDLEGLRADGTIFPVELSITEVGTRESPVFAGFLRDATARHELEKEQSRLLHAALLARAQAEAAGVRAEDAREEAEHARIEAEEGRARLAFLSRAGQAMAAGSVDWEQTLQAVVRSAVPEVAEWVTLTMAGSGRELPVVAVAHARPEHEGLARALAERHPPRRGDPYGPAHVIATGSQEVFEDLTPQTLRAWARDGDHLDLLLALDPRHSIVQPLRTRDGVIGALSFCHTGSGARRFTSEDRALIVSLAARAALHIQNARLVAEQSQIARTLQLSLLPRPLPEIPGARLAARFLPAGDLNEVGGDFYDVFPTAPGAWTAIVGDVSGKGAGAAALTALTRHTLRAAALLGRSPSENLTLLNRAMQHESDERRFCTVVQADVRAGRDGGIALRFANGGHPPPLLLRGDGAVTDVDAGRGPLVGVLRDPRYREATLALGRGEVLLLYTDGVTEIRTSDVEFGERHLRTVLADHAGAPAQAIVDAVAQRALELQDGRQRDDIALLAIEAVGEGSEELP